MRLQLRVVAAVWVLGGVGAGCKSREEAAKFAAQTRAVEAKRLMAEAQHLLSQEKYPEAARAVQQAGLLLRTDAEPYLLLFEIRRIEGNSTAAALALQHAAELKPSVEPTLKKQLADMYIQEGRVKEAIAALIDLRNAGRLSASELCRLAQLQARTGDSAGSIKTLERVQESDPDDPEAKAVEAEALLVAGKEMLASKVMDRLLTEHPDLAAARMLRARYFYSRDYLNEASADLARLPKSAAQDREVVVLKASILLRRHQPDEAEVLLQDALTRRKRDVALISQLAEAKLELKKEDEADELVETALSIRPRYPRALYVQGRAAEMNGRPTDAIRSYQDALREDPSLAPALSRMWHIQLAQGEKVEAMASLERLVTMEEATISEKVALAEMYLAAKVQLGRALKLAEEAIRRDPNNPRYVRLRSQLGTTVSKRRGILIIRGKKLR